jgi:hypothetical protein
MSDIPLVVVVVLHLLLKKCWLRLVDYRNVNINNTAFVLARGNYVLCVLHSAAAVCFFTPPLSATETSNSQHCIRPPRTPKDVSTSETACQTLLRTKLYLWVMWVKLPVSKTVRTTSKQSARVIWKLRSKLILCAAELCVARKSKCASWMWQPPDWSVIRIPGLWKA